MADLLDEAAVADALTRLPGWRRDGDELVLTVTAPSFLTGIDLVNQVATIAEAADHHPDIDIRWSTVRFACSTHSAGGLTAADTALAGQISAAAAAVGAGTD
jgi:4a-hydroxytetrahydrobiopterin dehydratase